MQKQFYEQRIGMVLEGMKENRIDCFLVSPSSDLIYLSGYAVHGDERFLALVLAPGITPFLLANGLYEQQAREAAVTQFCFWADGEDPFAMLKAELKKRGIGTDRIALDAVMPARFVIALTEQFPDAKLVNGNRITSRLRLYKDRAEMDAMIAATSRADEALAAVLQKGREWIGRTEADFLDTLVREMAARGIAGGGGIVAVGPEAAVPHHVTGNTVIQDGTCLLADFGGTFDHYQTDMTRTVHFGEPSSEFREVYEIVLEANLAGEAAAVEGNLLEDVDRAARSVIEKCGYGKYFIHRTGHGIGIDCHEGPSAQEGEKTPIRRGMAFSCEPGIYLPGRFGVRIEDQVLIEEDGHTQVLHHYPKTLQVL